MHDGMHRVSTPPCLARQQTSPEAHCLASSHVISPSAQGSAEQTVVAVAVTQQ